MLQDFFLESFPNPAKNGTLIRGILVVIKIKFVIKKESKQYVCISIHDSFIRWVKQNILKDVVFK